MMKVESILCPTDLSAESDEGLRYGISLACAYKAKLILLYCRHPGSIVDWATSSGAARRFQQTLFSHMDATEVKALGWEAAIAETDNVGEAIVAEAGKRKIDLIVMRSRRRPHAAVLLGSTAETVSQNAPCPVLVTHPNEREWVGFSCCDIDLQRVLVATDFSSGSELALHHGLSMAKQYRAEIHLLHVVSHEEEEEPAVVWSHTGMQSLYKSAAHRLQQTIPKAVLDGCKSITAVRGGEPWREIIQYAKEQEIDLICVGASGRGFALNKLFGSTADRLLRHAPCPVLVARQVPSVLVSAQAA